MQPAFLLNPNKGNVQAKVENVSRICLGIIQKSQLAISDP